MKRYDMACFQIKNKKQYIIFSTSHISPLKFIKDIENELKDSINEEVEILFDLLLSSGNNQERYGSVIFNGKEFDKNTFRYISVEKSNLIRSISTDYYKKKNNWLENSILNSIQKKMIYKGITI